MSQQPYQPQGQPYQQPRYGYQSPNYGYQQDPRQGRDGAQYVRQQRPHSLVKHILLVFVGVGMFTIPYYSLSPNHYWTF